MSEQLNLEAIAQKLGLKRNPSDIISDLSSFTEKIDHELDAASEGLGLPCKKGCDACCHEAVFLSAPEFLRVVAYLQVTRSASERQQLMAAMLELATRFEDEFDMLETFAKGPERDEVAARVKFRCPLLRKDGACSVYPAREVNGRTFGRAHDGERNHAYGCELTQSRLRVLPHDTQLPDARDVRRRLAEAVPEAQDVRTYPQWFLLVRDVWV